MLAIAILAAGKGTRMNSSIPKVLQELSGTTLLERVLNSCNELKPDKTFIIVGHEADRIQQKISHIPQLEFVHQTPQNGTGHAIQQLLPILNGFSGELLVLNGDVPLLKEETIEHLISKHRSAKACVSMLTARIENPKGYGRVFSDDNGNVEKIIEDSDCTETELMNNLTNSGVYCFDWQRLSYILPNLTNKNEQKEIYITDTIKALSKAIHIEVDDSGQVSGVNDKKQLAECENLHQERLRNYWMKEGVRFINPTSSTINENCRFGKDVVIEPQTHLRGKCIVGKNSVIGPNTYIENSEIGSDVSIFYSVVKDSTIESNVQIGPFAHIRPKTSISNNCKIGNFVEIKQSKVMEGSKINHLSYIGDSELGEDVNIGAGTITANFDGEKKHKTKIGRHSKTGANSVLVAPVDIGEDVTIGAGSTITKDVPDKSLAIERSKQFIKSNWNNYHKSN